ncbi:hypothetical protein GLYMA_16G132200v4 [Glycine max]|nr:hypothetical protein GLYMA_16G132200v4 [Glycine max]
MNVDDKSSRTTLYQRVYIDSNAVEDFLGYIGVEVQITTSHQYFLGHLWKIIIGKQRFKVRRTMDIKA